MEFKKFEFDDLSDMEADELRELVHQFNKAHETNLETFEEVSESVEEFSEYEADLTEEVVEMSSLSEEAAKALPFSEKKSLISDLNAPEAGGEGEEVDEETDFEDRGTKGKTDVEDENKTPEFIEDAFDGISGVEL